MVLADPASSEALGLPPAVAELFEAKREAARRQLPELRSQLEQSGSAAAWYTDETLIRFLENNVVVKNMEVRRVSIKHAAEQLGSTVKWRTDLCLDADPPSYCSCETCDREPYAHCFFSVGRDKRGWEVTYTSPGRTTAKDYRSIEAHFIAFLEATFNPERQKQQPPPTHLCICVDLHGFGLGDLDPRVAVRCIKLILNHYPDRVGQVAFLDAPWIFKAIWDLCKTVLDPAMQQKATMLRGDAMAAYFDRFFTPDQRQFMDGMLCTRARPNRAAFVPVTTRVRKSLGACDAFTRESRRLEDAAAAAAAECVEIPAETQVETKSFQA